MITITTFYRFIALAPPRTQELQTALEQLAATENLRGLCLLGPEGINATICGPQAGIAALKSALKEWLNVDLEFKDSSADKFPFHVFKVKIKDEIVSLGTPELVPSGEADNHLPPEKWQEYLDDPETVVLDTRNDYEVEIGKFKNAVDFKLEEFNEFPERLKDSNIPKDKRVLIYCTGGIRCEKAILEMRRQGYGHVFQLQGGILNYLEKYPERDFEGECFVFDYRVAVDQNLKPTSRYKLCAHCGQPAGRPVLCRQCGSETYVCSPCAELGGSRLTCSKNCAHHLEIGSQSRKPHLQELKKRSSLEG